MKKVFFFFPSLLRVWRGLMTHVNIIRARKGRGRINAAITARLDAQACKPDRKFNWIPSNSSWISSPRVVDFQRDGRIKQHQTHKISLTNSFSSSTTSTRCERSRNCFFLIFYLSRYYSFFVSQRNTMREPMCASRSLARDREAVVRENQANHAGGPFSRGEGKATRSNGNSLKRRGLWTLVVDRYRTPIFPNPISRNVINIIFLKLSSSNREQSLEKFS